MAEKLGKNTKKIIGIITIQIVIILASFLVLEFLESEKTFSGNSVNISGKNRFLIISVISEVKSYHIGGSLGGDPILKLETLKENFQFLKDGGQENELVLHPLPEKFHEKWNKINELLQSFENDVHEFVLLENSNEQDIISIENTANELVSKTDFLTRDLGLELQLLSTNLLYLQIILAMLNIGIHILLIWILLKLLKKESEQLVKMERLYTIGQLAARMSHDLKNPLSILQMTLQTIKIQKEYYDEKMLKHFDIMERGINRMLHQINDVMDFVRIRETKKQEISIQKLLDESLITHQISDNISLELPKSNLNIVCDPQQIQVVLNNLVHNSIQSIGPDDKGYIKFRVKEEESFIVIEVEDSGPGIPDDVLPQIFEPLFTTKMTGTGLGLVSCLNIIKAHGGTIDVKNNPTTFTIKIPKTPNK